MWFWATRTSPRKNSIAKPVGQYQPGVPPPNWAPPNGLITDESGVMGRQFFLGDPVRQSGTRASAATHLLRQRPGKHPFRCCAISGHQATDGPRCNGDAQLLAARLEPVRAEAAKFASDP